jgi:hypothetical protein
MRCLVTEKMTPRRQMHGWKEPLRYLRNGLAVLLVFTASKMLGSEWMQVSAAESRKKAFDPFP